MGSKGDRLIHRWLTETSQGSVTASKTRTTPREHFHPFRHRHCVVHASDRSFQPIHIYLIAPALALLANGVLFLRGNPVPWVFLQPNRY